MFPKPKRCRAKRTLQEKEKRHFVVWMFNPARAVVSSRTMRKSSAVATATNRPDQTGFDST